MEKSAHIVTGTGRSSHSDYATGLDVPWFESRQRLEILSSPKHSDLLWDHPASYSMGTEVLCRRVKLSGREVNSTPASSGEVKSDWSYVYLLLLLGAELPLVVESFSLLNDIFPFRSILDACYTVFNLHLANILFDVILPSVLGFSL